jgi:predicted acyltransferase
VGNAMSFVMLKWENKPASEVIWKILKRTIIIFLLGYLMYGFHFSVSTKIINIISAPFSHTRILGFCKGLPLLLCRFFHDLFFETQAFFYHIYRYIITVLDIVLCIRNSRRSI